MSYFVDVFFSHHGVYRVPQSFIFCQLFLPSREGQGCVRIHQLNSSAYAKGYLSHTHNKQNLRRDAAYSIRLIAFSCRQMDNYQLSTINYQLIFVLQRYNIPIGYASEMGLNFREHYTFTPRIQNL